MNEGESGDPMDQFHRNEAISAVADDGFLAEEDDDYDDLYNDVNVGEGFLQSLNKNNNIDDLGIRTDDVPDKKPPPQSNPVSQDGGGASLPGGGGSGEGSGIGGVVPERVNGFQNQGSGGVGGIRVELGQPSVKLNQIKEQIGNDNIVGVQQPIVGVVGSVGNEGLGRQGGGNLIRVGGNGVGNSVSAVTGVNTAGGPAAVAGGGGVAAAGGTVLFVGDMHWWTTDAELEAELCKYGPVKEVKFFDEKASGKSKGYCQVEFFEPFAATACKEGMNGHVFNGRSCVVAYASPYTVKKMGEAQVNRNQQGTQSAAGPQQQGNRGPAAGGSNIATGGNYQGGDGNNRGGYGRGNWGRGNNPGMGNRGAVNPMRNRGGGMGGRGMMGNGGNGFGQGIGGTPPMMHPQSMMNQGFDHAFGGPMGRMGGYGGFPGGPTPPFPGMMPSFPGVGLPGVAPHVNPAFFGRGMPVNGMGMMPASGMDGPNMGMWPDPSMGGWGGEEQGGGAGESSYGEEAASDHQYGEVSHDRSGWPNSTREKDKGSERDWSGSSERKYKDDRDQVYERDAPREKDIGHDHEWSEKRHHDDREVGRERDRDRERDKGRSRDRDRDRERERDRERDRYRDDRDRYADHHRYRDREAGHEDEVERGRSSRTHSKSRLPQEEEHHSRPRDADYGKRRRLTSE
ncbi:PREDICTED: cleavage and polyadenylation specificity factor subunit CG7185-like isoform X2 [Lupinus angustifolius]|uniref:cleavage and polyadenylation specificity factor subunit CG7185-like isoform X2 n=1 Tax=Lupinus angustifolius TaxID=3871 RepID=UPI00092E7831|nr:PREDICTED: cleavage and polyadenylation specificity factor subunit CG7185-like isoform X2 [Lupinus angustifolius]